MNSIQIKFNEENDWIIKYLPEGRYFISQVKKKSIEFYILFKDSKYPIPPIDKKRTIIHFANIFYNLLYNLFNYEIDVEIIITKKSKLYSPSSKEQMIKKFNTNFYNKFPHLENSTILNELINQTIDRELFLLSFNYTNFVNKFTRIKGAQLKPSDETYKRYNEIYKLNQKYGYSVYELCKNILADKYNLDETQSKSLMYGFYKWAKRNNKEIKKKK